MKMTNSFHNTSMTTRKNEEDLIAIDYRIGTYKATAADKAFQRRAKRTLCAPDSGCTCSDSFGRRG